MREQIPADDWADQDLLTRSEATERLRDLIRVTERELAELPPGDPAAEQFRTRIAALEASIEDLRAR